MFPHTSRTSRGVEKLENACIAAGGALSVGLEPAPAYLPQGFDATIAGYEAFLRLVVGATRDVAAAYKFNLAFFESLGPDGIDLLYRIRADLPAGALVIADAKRGDIGTTAEHYARALYEDLRADSATVNPLMGRDACEPFLAHADKLTFFLVLTSNPGASDFLIPGGLYRSIATRLVEWNSRGNVGFVVGATRAEQVQEIRALAPGIPFLIPGIGAQGGDLDATAALGRVAAPSSTAYAGLLFHVTRGVLPAKDEPGDAAALIQQKSRAWRDRIAQAVAQSASSPPTQRSAQHVGR